MDHKKSLPTNSQDNTNDEQQHHQQDIDVMDCYGPSNECEPPKKKSKTDKVIKPGQLKLVGIFKKLKEQ